MAGELTARSWEPVSAERLVEIFRASRHENGVPRTSRHPNKDDKKTIKTEPDAKKGEPAEEASMRNRNHGRRSP